MRTERGFALLVVLWSLVLITLLTTQMLASGRNALTLAVNLRRAAEAQARADGAINEAVFHLLAGGTGHWQPDGELHVLGKSEITVSVRITSLAGKVNPNLASTALLAGLLQAVGEPPEPARGLATSIIQWRSLPVSKAAGAAALAAYRRAGLRYGPPGHAFDSLGELINVIGMPPALLAQVLPHMSLYQSGDPDPKLADPAVLRALVLAGQAGSNSNVYEGNSPVVSIVAEVDGPNNLNVRRYAIVSIGDPEAPSPFEVLALSDNAIETAGY